MQEEWVKAEIIHLSDRSNSLFHPQKHSYTRFWKRNKMDGRANSKIWLSIWAIILSLTGSALARTIHVDPNGSADFTAIQAAIDDAVENLPRSIREYIENVPLLVEDYPSAELVEQENISPQILGIFMGVPRTEAVSTEQVPDLDRVVVYKRNLEKICRDRNELVEQIQITVRHEIGHYLGLEESDMERLGLA